MDFKVSWCFIVLLLLCGMDAETEHMVGATSIRERCECLKTIDKVPWRRIADFAITNKGALCKNVQIVLYLKGKKEVCLNPDSKQGKRLQKCWQRIYENQTRKKACLRHKRRRSKN
ncbi:hypothetical protein COCON_G00037570 [Conger conger]|uniref:Chemokine interleukin-8-like domain-containing protein n=1 Tax=Conger conger TaxID=82655 RepID=A0A9Q1I5Z7_CONCO|nr:C-X-C motif chemokine 9-like [Conger conger]KAJ8284907.1 hypothetical protein COCON_G00037570 [Conger conger]